MQTQVFNKLSQIQIVIDYNGSSYTGLFGLEDLPSQMGLDKFEKFFTKCYSKEPNYTIEYNSQGDNLELKLIANLEFFSISHKLKFIKSTLNPNLTQEMIKNIVINLETKLDKTVTLVDLRSFEPIVLTDESNKDYNFLSYSSKHKIEYDLSEKIQQDQTNLLVGYKSSETKLDLSAYPYEVVGWTQLSNFYNLEEIIINGQSAYKYFSADSNQVDTSIFIKDVISIGTINPTVKKVTINNIYRVDSGLGHMDWAPELEELTLIGFKGQIKILKYIKRNSKLKKINLINCLPRLPDIPANPTPNSKPVYRDFVSLQGICDKRSYEIRQELPNPTSIVSPFANSSYALGFGSSKIKDFDYEDAWIELVKWCKSKSIEINVSGYQEDKETMSIDFPYMTKISDIKSSNSSNIINDRLMDQMTSMDPSGHMDWSKFGESVPKIFKEAINLDQIESNDPKSSSFATF